MKAKYFKKVRNKTKYYLVRNSFGLFGDFGEMDRRCIFKEEWFCVLAKSPLNACERAQKRGIGLDYSIREGVAESHAMWKVQESGKPDNHRYVTYF